MKEINKLKDIKPGKYYYVHRFDDVNNTFYAIVRCDSNDKTGIIECSESGSIGGFRFWFENIWHNQKFKNHEVYELDDTEVMGYVLLM